MAACVGLACVSELGATDALVVILQLGFAVANPTWNTVLTRAVGDDRIGQLVSLQQALLAEGSAGRRARAGLARHTAASEPRRGVR